MPTMRCATSWRGRGVRYEHLQTQPTPFNTLLWRVVGVNGDRYVEGLWSLVSQEKGLTLVHYAHRPDLLAGIDEKPTVQRLRWFTKGLYRIVPDSRSVVISDLRMGIHPDYVFAFRVAEMSNPHPRPIVPERVRTEQDIGRLRGLWEGLSTSDRKDNEPLCLCRCGGESGPVTSLVRFAPGGA